MPGMDDGFTLVQRRRKGKGAGGVHRDDLARPFLSSDVDATPAGLSGPGVVETASRTWRKRELKKGDSAPGAAEAKLHRIRRFADEIRERAALCDAVAAIVATMEALSADADDVPWAVVALGLGTCRFGTNTLVQLAFLSMLGEELAAGRQAKGIVTGELAGCDRQPVPVLAYDPAFDDDDAAVLTALGMHVWDPTAAVGSRAAGGGCKGDAAAALIFPRAADVVQAFSSRARRSAHGAGSALRLCMFLPHCDHPLTESVMRAYRADVDDGMPFPPLWICNSLSWVAVSQGWSDRDAACGPPSHKGGLSVGAHSVGATSVASPAAGNGDSHHSLATMYRTLAGASRVVGPACPRTALACVKTPPSTTASTASPTATSSAGSTSVDDATLGSLPAAVTARAVKRGGCSADMEDATPLGAQDGHAVVWEMPIPAGSTDDCVCRALDVTSLHVVAVYL